MSWMILPAILQICRDESMYRIKKKNRKEKMKEKKERNIEQNKRSKRYTEPDLNAIPHLCQMKFKAA